MKYRIKNGSRDLCPFIVQRKNEKSWFPFWRRVEVFDRRYDAENFVKKAVERHSKYKIGDIMFEYEEADLVVDRLKNSEKYNEDRDESRNQVTTGDVARSSVKTLGGLPTLIK